MRSWFQFGYDGFPSGELRKRFFRQRDDPCGSEEENDYDDEANDRPVFYYPLRRSEEGSSPTSSKGIPSDEEEELAGSSVKTARLPLYAHTTAYESLPALYGASLVQLAGQRVCDNHHIPSAEGRQPEDKATEHYLLWHGGASAVEPWVSDSFTLARLSAATLRSKGGDGVAHTAPYPGAVAYVPVPCEASLEDLLHTPLSHPALRACMMDPERLYGDWSCVPPRFGHCASPVVLPTALSRALLVEGLPNPTKDDAGRIVCPPVQSFLSSSVPNKDDYELHLTFIIGGAEKLPSTSASLSAGVPHPSSSSESSTGVSGVATQHPSGNQLPSSLSSPSSPQTSTTSSVAGGANRASFAGVMGSANGIRVLNPIRSVTMSRPALCFTLLRRPGSVGGAAHWTHCFDLLGSSQLPVEPRMFATLTPWPQDQMWGYCEDVEAHHTVDSKLSFLYLGGSETAIAPVPLFPVTVIQLDYRSWQWSAHVVQAFGAEPSPRFGHSTTYCDGSFFVFGGVGRDARFLNDLHILNGRTKVWREVFVPMNIGLPPRAFHCAPLLLLDFPSRKERRCDLFTVAPFFAQDDETVKPALVDEARGWLTERPTGAQLLICGGESEAGVEPSVWVCTLDMATWQSCYFPLLSQVQSYHVGSPFSETNSAGPNVGRASGEGLTAGKLQETIRALVERQALLGCRGEGEWAPHSTSALDGGSLSTLSQPPTTAESELFVSTVHGSLAQAVTLPACLGGGALLLGGTRSPPVLLATHLQLPHGTLKERVLFWLLSCPHSLPTRVMRRTPLYYWQILGPTMFRGYVSSVIHPDTDIGKQTALRTASSSSLSQVVAEAGVEADDMQRDGKLVSDNMLETNRLVSQGALDEQLSVWMRSAKRRLREERLT